MRAALLFVLVTLTGCMKWVPVEVPAPQARAATGAPAATHNWGEGLTLEDGPMIMLGSAALVGDSVRCVPKSTSEGSATTFAVAAARVRRIEVRRTDAVRTGLAIGGMAMAVAATVAYSQWEWAIKPAPTTCCD